MRFLGDADTARFEFMGLIQTVANSGLRLQHDGSLRVVVRLPSQPGWYPYTFVTGKGKQQVEEQGTLRVVDAQSTSKSEPAATQGWRQGGKP